MKTLLSRAGVQVSKTGSQTFILFRIVDLVGIHE